MKELTKTQMEEVQAGMPCGVALALYGAAFISLCATTGPLVILALASAGGALATVIEACKYKL